MLTFVSLRCIYDIQLCESLRDRFRCTAGNIDPRKVCDPGSSLHWNGLCNKYKWKNRWSEACNLEKFRSRVLIVRVEDLGVRSCMLTFVFLPW